MLSEQAKQWLHNEWGTFNPVRIDSSTAWDILKVATKDTLAAEVWGEYADYHRMETDPVKASKEILTYDDLIGLAYFRSKK